MKNLSYIKKGIGIMKKTLIVKRFLIGILIIAAVTFIIYTLVIGNRTKFYDDESTTGNPCSEPCHLSDCRHCRIDSHLCGAVE